MDFIKLTFDDSTIAPAQQALTEGDLPIAEAYETEYALLKRPVFSWKSRDGPKEVKPGKKAVLTVSCLGKVGWYAVLFPPRIHRSYASQRPWYNPNCLLLRTLRFKFG